MRALSTGFFDDLPKDGFPDPHPFEVRMDGDVVDLDFLPDLPIDDIADDLVEIPVDDDQWIGQVIVLDFSSEGGFMPRIGKGNVFNR
jgi:hypothetical protein